MKKIIMLCALSMVITGICVAYTQPPAGSSNLQQKALFYGSAVWHEAEPGVLSARHANLPAGTRIRITNLQNGKRVIVTITAPLSGEASAVLDISEEAAKNIGMMNGESVSVKAEVLSRRKSFRHIMESAPKPNAGKP
jgi:rare lipoprotein A